MELEITVTPRETLVWAAKAKDAQGLRHELTDSGYLVRDADPFALRHPLEPPTFNRHPIVNQISLRSATLLEELFRT